MGNYKKRITLLIKEIRKDQNLTSTEKKLIEHTLVKKVLLNPICSLSPSSYRCPVCGKINEDGRRRKKSGGRSIRYKINS